MPTCPQGVNAGFGMPPERVNAICSIRSDFGQVIRNGTGWLTRTEDSGSIIITAAHNLFHHGEAVRAQQLDLFFGRRGNVSTVHRVGLGFDFPLQFVTSGGSPSSDFGLIRVDTLDPAQCPPIPVAESTSPDDTHKLVVGYPNEDSCANTFMPHHVDATVFPTSSLEYGYRGNVVTYGGMSGGPHLARVDGDLVSFGILVRGPLAGQPDVPRAVRFSVPILQGLAALQP